MNTGISVALIPDSLSELFSITVSSTATHRWAEVQLPPENRTIAAVKVAEHIAQQRCGGAPQFITAWAARRSGGPPHSSDVQEILAAFLGSESIGTPSRPADQVHLEGFVAEHVWHLLTIENALTYGTPVRVEGPDWAVTDSGGDGLAIYRTAGTLVFRLWESKAHTGKGTVKDVVNHACKQVGSNALRYLARFSKVGQHLPDAEFQSFYGRMPELWRARAPEAGGGISVATGSSTVSGCFDGLRNHWSFTHPDQRHGLVVVISKYSDFATLVRTELWKGL